MELASYREGIYRQRASPAAKSGGMGWLSFWVAAWELYLHLGSESLALLSQCRTRSEFAQVGLRPHPGS
jgi:hypothetical protein